MNRRNWLDLSRKLVDRFDFDYTMNSIQSFIGQMALSYWGEGVLITTTFPNPFPITMSGVSFGGSVGTGIGYDAEGSIAEIPSGSGTFPVTASHASLNRWDLLVIRYKMTGDTLVPKPSDPINDIFLNLHDDYELAVIAGTPGVSPAYPAKGALDIILAGLQVPPASTLGNQITVDTSIRENAQFGRAAEASFVQEHLGNGPGTNFTLSQQPLNLHSVMILVDGAKLNGSAFSVAGQAITLLTAPGVGQSIDAYYVANDPQSQNPLSGYQEEIGTGNGVTTTFNLTGKPANQASTLVFVDGIASPIASWNFIQGTTDAIQFLAGSIPFAGQKIDTFYLVNANTVGSAPSNSSAYVTYGSPASPLSIDPTAGITVSTDPLQLRFVKGLALGGAQTVTAIPQVANGSAPGQELKLKGTSDTDYLILNDGNGLSLNGTILLKNKSSIVLTWDGSLWEEDSRKA